MKSAKLVQRSVGSNVWITLPDEVPGFFHQSLVGVDAWARTKAVMAAIRAFKLFYCPWLKGTLTLVDALLLEPAESVAVTVSV